MNRFNTTTIAVTTVIIAEIGTTADTTADTTVTTTGIVDLMQVR